MFRRPRGGIECKIYYRDEGLLPVATCTFAACPRRGEHVYFRVGKVDKEYWVLSVTHVAAGSLNQLGHHLPQVHLKVTDKPDDFTELAALFAQSASGLP